MAGKKKSPKKTFVLDTNILMHSPNAIYGFDNNDIVITGTTLQELDKHKGDVGETGYNTREVIRCIDKLSEKGSLKEGVELDNGGTIFLEANGIDASNLPKGYSLDVPDNRIISAVLTMEKSDKYHSPVILVTNDISMRLNARSCDALVQSYKNETVQTDENYTGKTEIHISSDAIDTLYRDGELEISLYSDEEFIENEYVIVKSIEESKKSAICVYREGKLTPISEKNLRGFGGVKGQNLTQKFLMHALLEPASKLPLVIVKGPAGTGKTFLSIACALAETYNRQSRRYEDNEYEQVLITRTNTQSDADLGFLPGTLEEKMDPLVAPFMDNMKDIFAGKERDLSLASEQIDYVMQKEIVKICAVNYMRGRSFRNSYLIIDESQNTTVKQILELITRAGEGTKIVLLGDPDQIDLRYLDKRSNGLVFAAEKMKNSPLCAQITFDQDESVRSELAMEAAKRMTI